MSVSPVSWTNSQFQTVFLFKLICPNVLFWKKAKRAQKLNLKGFQSKNFAKTQKVREIQMNARGWKNGSIDSIFQRQKL